MKKYFSLVFWMFLILFVLFFGGGILGMIFSIKHYNRICDLEQSNIVDSAVVTGFYRRQGSSTSITIYFATKSDNKMYKYSLSKFPYIKINTGDEIVVNFNEDRTRFFITNYSSAIFTGYYIQIILFIVLLILSGLFLFGTIEIYRKT
jgi:hypothetical protein